MTLRTEIQKDLKEFFRRHNVFSLLLLFFLFLVGVSLIVAGFYILPETAPGVTRIEVEGHRISTPGNLLQVIGAISALLPLYAFFRMIGGKEK